MSKQSAQKQWAESVKAEVAATPTRNLKRVGGGGDPVKTFYQFSKPKQGAPESAVQLTEGTEINGSYEGTLTTKKFQTVFYKIRTANSLVAIPSSGQLKAYMDRVPKGADVQIIYRGMEAIKSGRYAGKESHQFIVNASEVVPESN